MRSDVSFNDPSNSDFPQPCLQNEMSATAAQLLVNCLEANGYRRAFGVPGESYLDLLDALYDAPFLRYITCRHEGGAAMAACAHGQLTGFPGLCMVTRGPGATNASAGLHVARQGGVPMLLLVGQVPRGERHRQSFQELDYARALPELCKWTIEITDADRIPEFVARATHVSMSGLAGPVALILPEDMLADSVTAEPIAAANPAPGTLAPETIERIHDLLADSARPFLVLGGIGWNQRTSESIAEFAAQNQIPTGFSFRAHDCLDNRNECVVGPLGIGGSQDVACHLAEADLVILCGPRLGDDTGYLDGAIRASRKRLKLVHLHPDPDEPGRVFVPDVAATISPGQAAASLAPIRGPVSDARREWRAACRATYERVVAVRDGPDWYLSQIVHALRRLLPDDAILCNGAGNTVGWLHRFFQHHQTGTALGPVSGSMGYDLPAALAAALERPTTPVVAWCGDGSFLMTCQELSTAHQFGARFVAIVVDNGLFGTIRMHQEKRFPGRISGTVIHRPDFVGLAHSLGAHAERAEDLAQFETALGSCLAHEGPSLIHLPVDPDILAPGLVVSR